MNGPDVDQMVERITYGGHRSSPTEAGGNIFDARHRNQTPLPGSEPVESS